MTPCCQSGGSHVSPHSSFFLWVIPFFFNFLTDACLSGRPTTFHHRLLFFFFFATPTPPISPDRISTFPTYTSLRAFNCPASPRNVEEESPKAHPTIRWLHRRHSSFGVGGCVARLSREPSSSIRVPTLLPRNQRTDSLMDFQQPPLISCHKAYQTDGHRVEGATVHGSRQIFLRVGLVAVPPRRSN